MGSDRPSSSYGHLALHYPKPEYGPKAARLLQELGFHLSYDAEMRTGAFWHFVLDEDAEGGTDRIVYLMSMPPQVSAVYQAIRDRVGDTPEAQALRAAQADDPELNFHAAVVVHSLDELEAMVQRVQALVENDPAFKEHIRIVLNRARPGTPEVDARMDASPIFAGVTRYTYGRNGVQVFIETDLVSGGPLGDTWVFEFDYVFPGYKENILNRPSPETPPIAA